MPTTNGAATRTNKRTQTGDGNGNEGRRSGGFVAASNIANATQGANANDVPPTNNNIPLKLKSTLGTRLVPIMDVLMLQPT